MRSIHSEPKSGIWQAAVRYKKQDGNPNSTAKLGDFNGSEISRDYYEKRRKIMKKRILSIILVLVMIFSMLPTTAFAAVTADND